MDKMKQLGQKLAALKASDYWEVIEEVEWILKEQWGSRLLQVRSDEPCYSTIMAEYTGMMKAMGLLQQKREECILAAKKEDGYGKRK